MMGKYFNQSLTWKHAGALNDYGEPTYTTTTIKGRKENGFKVITDKMGKQVVSSAQIFTLSSVLVDDVIDNQLVLAVEDNVKLNGSNLYNTVYLT